MRHTRISNRKLRLCLERLEDRLVPATVKWVGDRPTADWADFAIDVGGGGFFTNWSGDQIPSGNSLVFDDTAVNHFSNNNDFPSLSVQSLSFNADGYTVSGNALNITTAAGITQSADISTQLNLGINVAVAQTWTAGGLLSVDGKSSRRSANTW